MLPLLYDILLTAPHACRYTFPCEAQALYTQDVPVQRSAAFEESTFALHRIELPQATPLSEHLCALQDGSAGGPGLVFELFDCFDDGVEDRLHASGALPMAAVLGAASPSVRAP